MSAAGQFTRPAFLLGFRRAWPLVIGLTPFGLVTGILAQAHGLSLVEAGLMSGLCFSGSAEVLALGQWAVPAPVIAVTLSALVVNLRLMLMGPVLSPWLNGLRGWRLWGSLAVMVDQNWALSVDAMRRGEADAGFLAGSGALVWTGWLITTLAGFELGALVQPPPGHPVFFAATAVFVSLLVRLWRGRSDWLPWAVAAVVSTVAARWLPGSWYIVAGALSGSVAGVLGKGRRA